MIDLACRTSLGRGSSAQITTELRHMVGRYFNRGGAVVFLVRQYAQNQAWRAALRGLHFYETSHCACKYPPQVKEHVRFKVYHSGMALSSLQCKSPDTTGSLSRRDLDAISSNWLAGWCLKCIPGCEGNLALGDALRKRNVPEGEPAGSNSGAPQHLPDSNIRQQSFPTDAKERERARRTETERRWAGAQTHQAQSARRRAL